jgi:uncharacterized protein (DUF3084 family)
MTEGNPDVTLETLHGDLTMGFSDMKAEMRAGFADLKVTMVAGFASLPTRESSEDMVQLLREGNRLNEAQFTRLDVRIREQHLETQQVLHALVESQRALTTEVRAVSTETKGLAAEIKSLAADIKRLIARIDALIRGRNNGEPA